MESKKFEESLKKLLKWNEIKKVYCYFEIESKKNEFRCYSHEHKKKGHEIKINEVYQKISKLIKSSNDLQTPIDYLSCDSLKKLAKDEPCISEYREGKYYLFLGSSEVIVKIRKFTPEKKGEIEEKNKGGRQKF